MGIYLISYINPYTEEEECEEVYASSLEEVYETYSHLADRILSVEKTVRTLAAG